MHKRLHILAAAVLAVGGIGLISPAFGQATPSADQQQQPAAGGAASGAGGAAAQPSAGAGGAAAAQPSGASAQTAGASQVASQSDVSQALSQTAQAAISGQGLQGISQQLCQKDQQRLGDLSKADQTGAPAADQLKQAYKEKFQQDLDLSKNADAVFTATFFRIGGDIGDQARQASARVGASDTGAAGAAGTSGTAGASGTAGTSGASSSGAGASRSDNSASGAGANTAGGAAGTGTSASAGAAATPGSAADQAQTAGAAAAAPMQATVVVIPASHGMPEARLNLVKEGGSWKIDLPDSIDAQKLSQNLQTQLQQAAQMKDQWGTDAAEGQRAVAHAILVAFSEPQAAGATGAPGAPGASGTSSGGTSGAGGSPGGTSGGTPGSGLSR